MLHPRGPRGCASCLCPWPLGSPKSPGQASCGLTVRRGVGDDLRLTTTHPRSATFPRRGVGRHPPAIWTPYRRFRLLPRVCLRWWPRGPLTALDLVQARRRRTLKRQPPHTSKWVARPPLPFLINQRELWPISGGTRPTPASTTDLLHPARPRARLHARALLPGVGSPRSL